MNTEHPSLTRARKLAHDSGSTAETTKGIRKWLSLMRDIEDRMTCEPMENETGDWPKFES